MPAIQLLIKPASGLCNMRCEYCFYYDIIEKRSTQSYGIMKEEILEIIIKKTLAYAEYSATFAFQGGEPTLAGLSFFRKVVEFQKKYNKNKVVIHNALQTNGYALDDGWCQFLGENQFLTGLSLDGLMATHDRYRKGADGGDTFLKIMNTAARFDRFKVEYNILTVVNAKTAAKVRKIYEFYKKNGFAYQQYIACLDPVFEKQGEREYSLTPEIYGQFLMDLFDLWYIDLQQGKQPYIRQFENYVAILLGQRPESCEQGGICGIQHVVEADGEVYPCDFYVLDEYKLGNLTVCSFAEIAAKRSQLEFVDQSANHDVGCTQCQYFSICRGGCARHRVALLEGTGSRNYFCKGYTMFFEHCLSRLADIAHSIKIQGGAPK